MSDPKKQGDDRQSPIEGDNVTIVTNMNTIDETGPDDNTTEITKLKQLLHEQQQMFRTFVENQLKLNETLLGAVTSTPRKTHTREVAEIERPQGEKECGGPVDIGNDVSSMNKPFDDQNDSMKEQRNTASAAQQKSGQSSFYYNVPRKNLANTQLLNEDSRDNVDYKQLLLSLASNNNNSKRVKLVKPEFEGGTKSNPVVFLKLFEQYCNFYKFNEVERIELIKTCFSLTVLEWFELNEHRWHNFQQFKSDFLAYFWSEDKQYIQRTQLSRTTFVLSKMTNMSEFFLQQISKYRTFVPPVSEFVAVSEIMRQFPQNIQVLWAATGNNSVMDALKFLERQDNLVPINAKPKTKSEAENKTLSKNVNTLSHPTVCKRVKPNVDVNPVESISSTNYGRTVCNNSPCNHQNLFNHTYYQPHSNCLPSTLHTSCPMLAPNFSVPPPNFHMNSHSTNNITPHNTNSHLN